MSHSGTQFKGTTTDVDNKAILLIFVQYIFQKDVHEDLLYALFLPTNTIATKLFKSLNDYISGRFNWSSYDDGMTFRFDDMDQGGCF